MDTLPIIAITMGDINGIGPEIIVKALTDQHIYKKARFIVVGNLKAYTYYAKLLNSSVIPEDILSPEELISDQLSLGITELGYETLPFDPGHIYPENSIASTEWIRQAVAWALEKRVDAIVTAPITKDGLAKANIPYDGHTTMIAHLTGTKDYRMTLYTKEKWIVHHTGHLSILEAISKIRLEPLIRTIEICYEQLKKIYHSELRIAVAGLNPHAGENGLFGKEEIEIIEPAVKVCRAKGIPCSGPYPPDTVFRRLWLSEFNAVVAMYHDQGHIPLKLVAMDEGVNITLGLPIIRTSVDHGTAFDIAGKGVASEKSLVSAIDLAIKLSKVKDS
ncbi:MAG: 4-hydroxythreonine-4-phosphate dehydrogenase PdxA [Candidatus Hydrogenedentes bacterium]|nr:4-hydroxythreonine-4-phosphate dehydrogenase PdxA [Candidatus Hydrogenedentota bacterium]